MSYSFVTECLVLVLLSSTCLAQEDEVPFKNLKTFNGNTHAHTIFSYSHGSHLKRSKDFVKGDKLLVVDSFFLNRPNKAELKKNWDSFQGLPEKHFREAKKAGYDFYFVTDHSQEEAFYPYPRNNTAWAIATKQAEIATNEGFTALMGVEHSENDSYKKRVHINVIGPSSYVNALRPEVDLPYFYDWLAKNPTNAITGHPVVAQFNHPIKNQFNDFVHKDRRVVDIIALLEVINGKKVYYEGFVEALDNGWRVSPSAGLDNHNYTAIATAPVRTFILAEKNTPVGLLKAIRKRRTYASFDKNIECRYVLNDSLMGSTIKASKNYALRIYINDPDKADETDKISKIQIVGNNGKVIRSIMPKNMAHKGLWDVSLKSNEVESYIFVQVFDNLNRDRAMTWLAPVWIKK